MDICNMQFNMSHPIDIVFNAIDDLIEMSEYALIPISFSQAVNLAYVEFARNPITTISPGVELLFSIVLHMGCHEKKHLREAQCDRPTIPPSSRTDVQSRIKTSKLGATTREYLIQWSTSHSKHVTITQQLLCNSSPNRHIVLFQCF